MCSDAMLIRHKDVSIWKSRKIKATITLCCQTTHWIYFASQNSELGLKRPATSQKTEMDADTAHNTMDASMVLRAVLANTG